jgi:ferrochelatase
MARGCTEIAILPMYPQFSASTTASVYDGVAKALKTRENAPTLRLLRDYRNHPDYIAALGNSLTNHIKDQGWEPDVILASFHGIPKSYVDKGDPYPAECAETTDLLRKHVGMSEDKLRLTFQSRFGPKEWLNPYTDKTLEALAKDGVKNVTLIAPGFAADCLETLEELSMEAHEIFMEAGGENFSVVPCLNASPAHIAALAKIAKSELLSGWT